MATIGEVAKRAGVSQGTVSRFLNGHRLKQRNMIRVQKAIEELDYRENFLAKSLRLKHTKCIGVLISNMLNTFASSVVALIESEMDKKDYSLMLCGYQNDPTLFEKKLRMLLERKVDGIILFEGSPDWVSKETLDNLDIPVVAINSPYNHSLIDSIVTDDCYCTQRMVSTLIKAPHKRLGIICGPQTEYTTKERLHGIHLALELSNSSSEDIPILFGDYSKQSGYRACCELLDNFECDSIFVTNYAMSQGALQAMFERNLSIGTDVSFAGFNYHETQALSFMSLSCICPETAEIATLAVHHILTNIHQKTLGQGITIPVPNVITLNNSIRGLQ